jgi:hypothetical protein
MWTEDTIMSINMTTPKDWDRVTHKATQQDWERANSPTPDHALNRYSFPGRDSGQGIDDPVNSPSHYLTEGGIECIDAMEAALGHEFAGYCKGAAFKYLWRASKKHDSPREDLLKCEWYLQRLLKHLD